MWADALTRTDSTVAFTFRTFDDLLDATVTEERLVALLSSFFGACSATNRSAPRDERVGLMTAGCGVLA